MAYTYTIENDTMADCPRNWDNIGTIATWHRRYTLGDVQPSAEPLEWARELLKLEASLVIMPVYMYDHSGITVSHTPFSCRWDSGQLGYMYTTLARYNQVMGTDWRRLSNKRRDTMREALISELKTYDQYLGGDVYVASIYDEDGEYVDGGGGYYDRDECEAVAVATIARLNEFEGVPA